MNQEYKMKIILERVSKTTPKEIIESRIDRYLKEGKQVKTEVRDDNIALYYVEKMD